MISIFLYINSGPITKHNQPLRTRKIKRHWATEWHAILISLVIPFSSLQNNSTENLPIKGKTNFPEIQKLITVKLEQKHNHKYN